MLKNVEKCPAPAPPRRSAEEEECGTATGHAKLQSKLVQQLPTGLGLQDAGRITGLTRTLNPSTPPPPPVILIFQ